jgi:ATP-dependent RNA helicase RhlE
MKSQTSSSESFHNLGIAPKLLSILDKAKFVTPTPIQARAISPALEGKDLIGIAQTGTGKTLAFGIPMIQRLAQSQSKGLVVLPTRELAMQVNESLLQVGKPLGLKTAVLIGGEPMHRQLVAMRKNPHVIIATPGRLIDHLQQKIFTLANISILVLDEADRMLDMGFAPQINQILEKLPKAKQTMLFSATMPSEIVTIATKHMKLPVRIEVAPQGSASKQVAQEVFFVHRESKLPLLKKLLTEHKGSILVFSRTKFGAKKIAKVVRDMGHSATEIHSNRSLNQRVEALEGFKKGKYRILVATDIAARGIDVTGIELVINYDIPENPEDYVHRIGRTGRATLSGKAISFATPEQKRDVRDIERLIRAVLPVSKLPENLPKHIPGPSESTRFDKRHTRSYAKRPVGRFSQSRGRQTNSSSNYKPKTHESAQSTRKSIAGTKIFWGSSSNAGYAERKLGQSRFHREREMGKLDRKKSNFRKNRPHK